MILFLPPAPHTKTFFDAMRGMLSDLETKAVSYPGYGDEPPISNPSIEAYASAISAVKEDTDVVGFHTGCLVALELLKAECKIRSVTLVDVPYFNDATKAKHLAGLDAENPNHAAFFAAFEYDLETGLSGCARNITVIATKSSLLEPTRQAAQKIKQHTLIERPDIQKPAFENPAMAELLRSLIFDNSQTSVSGSI